MRVCLVCHQARRRDRRDPDREPAQGGLQRPRDPGGRLCGRLLQLHQPLGFYHRPSGAEGTLYLNAVLETPDLYEQMLAILKDYDEDIMSINYDNSEENGRRHGVYKILSKSHKKALPLNVYGDGMKKAVLLMSAVIAAEDGVLLIDEFETAIHTSAMENTFRWILETCRKLNVQVFVTSHSKEAIDKLLKCSEQCLEEMAVYTLYKKENKTAVRRMNGRKAIEAQDNMGLELR